MSIFLFASTQVDAYKLGDQDKGRHNPDKSMWGLNFDDYNDSFFDRENWRLGTDFIIHKFTTDSGSEKHGHDKITGGLTNNQMHFHLRVPLNAHHIKTDYFNHKLVLNDDSKFIRLTIISNALPDPNTAASTPQHQNTSEVLKLTSALEIKKIVLPADLASIVFSELPKNIVAFSRRSLSGHWEVIENSKTGYFIKSIAQGASLELNNARTVTIKMNINTPAHPNLSPSSSGLGGPSTSKMTGGSVFADCWADAIKGCNSHWFISYARDSSNGHSHSDVVATGASSTTETISGTMDDLLSGTTHDWENAKPFHRFIYVVQKN